MINVWLIGAGLMAQDYIKVLSTIKCEFKIIGRSQESAKLCEESTGVPVIAGGLEKYLESKPSIPSHAIVAVGVEKLYETTKQLLEYGVKNILVEKPGALYTYQFDTLAKLTKEKGAIVSIAYNRRFYASVLAAEKIIKEDGGVLSFNFEFTEWAHVIEPLNKGDGVKEKWLLSNSTHVIDLAFYLCGKPKNMESYASGSLCWHPSGSVFSGAGLSEDGALFSYYANWESAGRWGLSILTKNNKLIFEPMEKLQIQSKGTIKVNEVDNINYELDTNFKPGLYLQTKNFLNSKLERFCSIEEMAGSVKHYNKIANYTD